VFVKNPVFISYAREDSEFALRLVADLKKEAANVWLDQLDIRPGQQWDSEVERAFSTCNEMLVILSPAAVDSTNVMDEVAFALEERKAVIPVLHRECRLPFRLRRLQFIDLRSDYQRGLKTLLIALAEEERIPFAAEDTGSIMSALVRAEGDPKMGRGSVESEKVAEATKRAEPIVLAPPHPETVRRRQALRESAAIDQFGKDLLVDGKLGDARAAYEKLTEWAREDAKRGGTGSLRWYVTGLEQLGMIHWKAGQRTEAECWWSKCRGVQKKWFPNDVAALDARLQRRRSS
jgi:hypothetical protein